MSSGSSNGRSAQLRVEREEEGVDGGTSVEVPPLAATSRVDSTLAVRSFSLWPKPSIISIIRDSKEALLWSMGSSELGSVTRPLPGY